jgi:hypothetical protein
VWLHAGVQIGHMDSEELNISHWFKQQGFQFDRV